MIAPLNSTTHDHMAWGPWGTSASPANARCRVSLRKELRNTGSLVAEKLQSRVERLCRYLVEARRVITHIFAHQVRSEHFAITSHGFYECTVDFFEIILMILRGILKGFWLIFFSSSYTTTTTFAGDPHFQGGTLLLCRNARPDSICVRCP